MQITFDVRLTPMSFGDRGIWRKTGARPPREVMSRSANGATTGEARTAEEGKRKSVLSNDFGKAAKEKPS